MNRRNFIKEAGLAGSLIAMPAFLPGIMTKHDNQSMPVNLHVHLTPSFTIAHLMEISKQKNIRFGVVENPGMMVKDDASLKQYIEKLRNYPVYIGLQPMSPGWSKNFSPELIAQLDYVLMDPQTIPNGNSYGDTLRIWSFDTYVNDAEDFMEKYVAHSLEVLNNPEPLNVFSWPLFLPVCIARDYYSLWTEDRMQQIIAAAKKRNVAIEINDTAHTPHEKFILLAKEQGLKFTFGSDTRDQKSGRLDYCLSLAQQCNLVESDFYVPARILQ